MLYKKESGPEMSSNAISYCQTSSVQSKAQAKFKQSPAPIKMYSASAPIMYSRFDATQIAFDGLTKNKRGGKMIKLSYGKNRGFIRIQTPPLYIPFGLSVFTEEGTSKTSTTLECRVNTDDPNSKKFIDALSALDDAVFNYCSENDVECFGKEMSPEVLREEFFRPCVRAGRPKQDGSGNWPPLLRVKVSGFEDPKVFDTDRREVDWESEEKKYKGFTVRLILQLQPVWFVNKMFGVSFRLCQMSIVDSPVGSDVFLFQEDDDSVVKKHSIVGEVKGLTNTFEDDDDYDV